MDLAPIESLFRYLTLDMQGNCISKNKKKTSHMITCLHCFCFTYKVCVFVNRQRLSILVPNHGPLRHKLPGYRAGPWGRAG